MNWTVDLIQENNNNLVEQSDGKKVPTIEVIKHYVFQRLKPYLSAKGKSLGQRFRALFAKKENEEYTPINPDEQYIPKENYFVAQAARSSFQLGR